MNHSDIPQPGEVRVEGAIVERVLTDADVRALQEGAEMPADRLGAHLKPILDATHEAFMASLPAELPEGPQSPGDEVIETGGECL